MKLKSVEIKNFRSIESANISCSPSCLVLVGVNEAGKSNVLKALSTLGNFQPTRDDIREASQDESPIDKAFVEFSVVLEKHDVERIVVRLESTLLQKGNHPIVILGKQSYTLSEFIGQNARGVFSVDLIKGSKQGMYYKFAPGWVLTEGWYKPSNTCPPDWVTSDGKILKNYRLIFGADYPEIPTEYLAQVEPRELLSIGSAIANYVGSNPPQVVAWQYSDNNLLPASISIEEFKSNPQMCVPLLNMFRMAGISNIAEAIDGLAGQTRNRTENFYARIANISTEHFRNVWQEHRDISFELKPDGDYLIPGVREENVFDFARRSDGFKRFVSFLLSVSANVRNGDLSNCLLLVDEPDISLHPSGARFLRDELIKISDTNTVVYSTHSVFMIDRKKIERHLIVTKTDEKTGVKVADDDNKFSEEVILNALGSSVFESLREHNLVFEGWKDKQLFEAALTKTPHGYAKLKSVFKDVGLCYGRGAKNIKTITPLLELAQRNCIIISDGDRPSREWQDDHVKDRAYGTWTRYDELITDAPSDVTSEDFIKLSAFLPILEEVQKEYALPPFIDHPTKAVGRLKMIDKWLASGGVDSGRKDQVIRIKDYVSNNLKVTDIEPSYYDFLTALASKMSRHTK